MKATAPTSRTHRAQGHAARRQFLAFASLFVVMAVLLPRAAAQTTVKEHQLKAAFLYNFTKFIDWPTNAFAAVDSPFVIGVAGETPSLTGLEQIARDHTVNGRKLEVRRISLRDVSRVHVLFVPSSAASSCGEWLAAAAGGPRLTVGECDAFAQNGGMIHLLLEGERIGFEINVDEMNAAGLKASAQLQRLAKKIRKKS
jgi:hypothetical protein